ncbi:hypothetical protein RHODO2019_18545 (plasmid) [Rhodococcus antarcticus]|uniref:Uncharacterized protein n=1 Tax=Rhodococcus antarcticus TaxID=2987751 RepID=A0ABY6P5R1_9NOCA|nr:hypothetical protein [Rhodococcus antarcticus]UZJ26992.1 hypothetical protein RHODO2019_18545 [Rhodococcus antarcticus]
MKRLFLPNHRKASKVGIFGLTELNSIGKLLEGSGSGSATHAKENRG